MKNNVFEFDDYREFLKKSLETADFGRGARSKLAQTLGVGNSFVSQVINHRNHLSIEHGQKVAEFLGMNEDEELFFITMIQKERAGTQKLERLFKKQLMTLKEKSLSIRELTQVKASLTDNVQNTYYSNWLYAALHILSALPTLNSRSALADHLKMPLRIVSEALDHLVAAGLVIESPKKIEVGKKRIHLGPDSTLLSRHHANWRVQALKAIDERSQENLHFSGLFALSYSDAQKVKNLILKLITENEKILKNTEEEAVFCVGIDFFKV